MENYHKRNINFRLRARVQLSLFYLFSRKFFSVAVFTCTGHAGSTRIMISLAASS